MICQESKVVSSNPRLRENWIINETVKQLKLTHGSREKISENQE